MCGNRPHHKDGGYTPTSPFERGLSVYSRIERTAPLMIFPVDDLIDALHTQLKLAAQIFNSLPIGIQFTDRGVALLEIPSRGGF
jgi:hypothetical protein